MTQEPDVTDEMVAAAAKVADEQIVPYDAWWDLTPEELARDMLKAALAMNSDDEAARGSRKGVSLPLSDEAQHYLDAALTGHDLRRGELADLEAAFQAFEAAVRADERGRRA